MSGLRAAKYIPHVALGTMLVAALLAALPSRFRVDLRHKLGTTLITISIKPSLLPNYIIIFNQMRKTKVSGPGDAFVQWALSLIEYRIGAKYKVKQGQPSSSNKGGYRRLLSEARSIMVLEELTVRGQVGLDDACTTALVCGALTVVSGMLPKPKSGSKRWEVCVAPVYHGSYFALKAKLVVRVSLLNAIKLVIFAKHVLEKL